MSCIEISSDYKKMGTVDAGGYIWYTTSSGKIITKTEAVEWALENNLCPDPDVLQYALKVRRNPLVKNDKHALNYAETLAEPIQRFADVLGKEQTKESRL